MQSMRFDYSRFFLIIIFITMIACSPELADTTKIFSLGSKDEALEGYTKLPKRISVTCLGSNYEDYSDTGEATGCNFISGSTNARNAEGGPVNISWHSGSCGSDSAVATVVGEADGVVSSMIGGYGLATSDGSGGSVSITYTRFEVEIPFGTYCLYVHIDAGSSLVNKADNEVINIGEPIYFKTVTYTSLNPSPESIRATDIGNPVTGVLSDTHWENAD